MLVNGTPVRVVLVDGTAENITLPKLTLRQLYVWAKHVSYRDMPALVAFCVGKPVEWIDTLSDESFGELAKACVEQNFQRAVTLSRSDPVIAAMLSAVLSEMVGAMEKLMTIGAVSNALSLKPAPSESVAVIGSESLTSPPIASPPSSPNVAG